MGVAQALDYSLRARKKTLSDLNVPYSHSMLSMIRKGHRKLALDMAPRLADALDHPALQFALGREANGGIGPEYLDGDAVDTHRSAIREMCMTELTNALGDIQEETTAKLPGVESEKEHRRRADHLLDVLEAGAWIYMYAAVQCEEYGFSMKDLSRLLHSRMKSEHFVQE